jgi:hypothetical protein
VSEKCYHKENSILKNTSFEKSNLKNGNIINKYCFVKDEVKISSLLRKTKNENQISIIDWLNFCCDICISYFIRNPVILGVSNRVVEVDEALSRKNQGLQEHNAFFRAYDREEN